MKLTKLTVAALGLPLLLITLANWVQAKDRTLKSEWQFKQDGKSEWMPATVPGCVYLDLLQLKKIPDPHYGSNEKEVQWVPQENWVYKTSFNITKEELAHDAVELVFEGLDTYAEVKVDGIQVLKADNMFRTWIVDIKNRLSAGTHDLEIRLLSPIKEALPLYKALPYKLPATNDMAEEQVSIFSRKAPFHYGWDWGPRLVIQGIYRPIKIRTWDLARIHSTLFQTTDLTTQSATIKGFVEIDSKVNQKASLTLGLDGKTQKLFVELQKGLNKVAVEFNVAKPRIWWTNGLGGQPMYSASVLLTQGNKVLDNKTEKIGIRTIEVENKIDQAGKSFTIKLNGRPVFMKGANYIPQDNFQNRVTPEVSKKLLSSAKEANMNMIRLWGGGLYEEDFFYEQCDELGLLIWHDLMFSCSFYPGDTAFNNNVKAELRDNLNRLRNHPSIGFWCGNNEMEWGWTQWGLQKRYGHSKSDSTIIWEDYKRLFNQLIPQWISEFDPSRFYHRSSPSANEDTYRSANKVGWGDNHDWSIWFGIRRFDHYRKGVSRFMSEYGFQSFPSMKMVKAFSERRDWELESKVMVDHQKHPNGNRKMRDYMKLYYEPPTGFKSFIYAGQVLQSLAMKTGIEIHRRAKPYNMGSLYWQLNDCWPAVSWSSIDYTGTWKATNFMAKEAFAPVLISPFKSNDTIYIHLVNDMDKDLRGNISISLMNVETHKEVKKFELPAYIANNGSGKYWTRTESEILGDLSPNSHYLLVKFLSGKRETARNLLFFKDFKEMKLPTDEPQIKIAQQGDNKFTISIQSPCFHYNLQLFHSKYEGLFSNNFLNLIPNEAQTITYISENPTTAKDLLRQIKWVSLSTMERAED